MPYVHGYGHLYELRPPAFAPVLLYFGRFVEIIKGQFESLDVCRSLTPQFTAESRSTERMRVRVGSPGLAASPARLC